MLIGSYVKLIFIWFQYLIFFFFSNFSIQAEPKLLPQVEEVTYAEPVLLPSAPSQSKMQQHSPKNTLRKPMGSHHHGANSETLFEFQDGYPSQRDTFRGRDNFGTLRSHQVRHISRTFLCALQFNLHSIYSRCNREKTIVAEEMDSQLLEASKRSTSETGAGRLRPARDS